MIEGINNPPPPAAEPTARRGVSQPDGAQQVAGRPEDETRGIVATYGYRLQPHTTLNASLGYTNTLVPAGLQSLILARDDNLYTLSLGASHQFDPKLFGTLTLRHQQRDSNDSAFSFEENSISASATMRF